MMRSLLLFTTLTAVSLPAAAQIDEKVANRLWESSKVLEELIQAPDGGMPQELLRRAECVAVIPAVKKAAFGFGGRYGRGVAVCRKDGGKGPWGAPSMLSLSGGSFGLQLGGQSTDVVLLFMTPTSMKFLLRDKVTLGGDASAAAGPKGRSASAETSASMRAEILSYARSRGLFAGVSVNGAVLQPDRDANRSLYNRYVEAQDLLVQGTIEVPAEARRFLDTLNRMSSGS
jgi:lipid-binding SYLF domain-containing protein